MLRHPLTEDAYLRLFEERDAPEAYAVIARNRAHLARWLPWAASATEASTHAFIRHTRRQLAENQGLNPAIIVDGAIAGNAGLVRVEWRDERAAIGYWLAEEYQGRGVMTAAVAAVIDYAFDTLGLYRLELEAAVDNARSRAIAERLGFTAEGIRRGAQKQAGGRLDLVMYGLLAPDRQARGNPRENAPRERPARPPRVNGPRERPARTPPAG